MLPFIPFLTDMTPAMPSLLLTLALLGAASAQTAQQVDADAVVRAIAAMEPAAQQTYLAQLERRLDLAHRILLPADQAAQRREAVAAALRQPNVGWDLVRELVLETDRRERAAIVRLIRQYRVKVYETYYGNRKEYDARLEALNRVLDSWSKHGSFDRQQVMVDWLIAGVSSAMPNSKGPLPTEPRFDLPGNIADILAADPKRGSGDLVGPRPDPNPDRTAPPREPTKEPAPNKEPAPPDRPAPSPPPSPRSEPPSGDDLPKPPSRNEPEYSPPPRTGAGAIDTSPLPPPMDPEPAPASTATPRPTPTPEPMRQPPTANVPPAAPIPSKAPATAPSQPSAEMNRPSRPAHSEAPAGSPSEADSSVPGAKPSPPPKPAADPPDEDPFADEDLASLAREAALAKRAEPPLSPPRLTPPPATLVEKRSTNDATTAAAPLAIPAAGAARPSSSAPVEPQQVSRRPAGPLQSNRNDDRQPMAEPTAAVGRLRELSTVDPELIVAHATDEPLPVQVNVPQLAARVAANSLNLRTLEAELDDDSRPWSRTTIENSLRRLRLLVEEQRHLQQFIELVPEKDRSRLTEFESAVPMAAQLARRISEAQRLAAGDGFRGSSAERQTELDHLDRLAHSLEEMHVGR